MKHLVYYNEDINKLMLRPSDDLISTPQERLSIVLYRPKFSDGIYSGELYNGSYASHRWIETKNTSLSGSYFSKVLLLITNNGLKVYQT